MIKWVSLGLFLPPINGVVGPYLAPTYMTGDGAHLVDVDVSLKLMNILNKMMYSYINFVCLKILDVT